MKWKNIIIGVGAGAAIATYLFRNKKGHSFITSNTALNKIKEEFKKDGPIDGSWIHMIPEKIERTGTVYNVYRGGISRTMDGALEQFEFMVDANTGTILEVKPSKPRLK